MHTIVDETVVDKVLDRKKACRDRLFIDTANCSIGCLLTLRI